MAQIVQTFQNKSSKFKQDVILDNVAVTLTFEWSVRSGYWFVTITDGTYTLGRKKLIANWPILRQSAALFPTIQGSLIARRTDLEADSEVTYDNLNSGWTLYYYDRFELADWEADNGL